MKHEFAGLRNSRRHGGMGEFLALWGRAFAAYALLMALPLMAQVTWRVHLGDDPRFADPAFDDSSWEKSAGPIMIRTNLPKLAKTEWHRAVFTLAPNLSAEPLAIAIPPLNETYDVYVGGVLVGRQGEWEPAPVGRFPRHRSFRIPDGLIQNAPVQVAIRRWTGASATSHALFGSANLTEHEPKIGPANEVEIEEAYHQVLWDSRRPVGDTASLVVLIGGLLSLALYFAQRKQFEALWLGLTLICAGAAPLAGQFLADTDIPIRSWLPTIAYGGQMLSNASGALFLACLCPRLRKPLWIVAGLQAYAGVGISQRLLTQVSLRPGFDYAEIAFLATFTTLVVAITLLWDRREAYSTWLAGALFLQAASQFWHAQLNAWIAPDWRFLHFGQERLDSRVASMVVFAIVALTVAYLRHRQNQEHQGDRDRDLALARAVQESLIGGAETPGFTVDAAYLPANEVGGDFYQAIPGDDGSLLLVVGDVSGKGLPASLLVAAAVGALGDLESRRPADVLAHLNRALFGKMRGGFVTCGCALFDRDGTMAVANAGHLPPYSEGREVEVESGLPLGVIRDADYAEARMCVSGAVTFVSDGVVEAASATGELFGFDRTRAVAGNPAQEIAAAAKEWGQNDDITVVTVRRSS